jgi:4-hydroxythreonine-4-phosphate dehydrogenase
LREASLVANRRIAVSLPRVAVTLGDPRGVGPEVVTKALRSLPDAARYVVFGPEGTAYEPPHTAAIAYVPTGSWSSDGDPAVAGELAAAAIRCAVEAALAGEVDALVTAPIDKRAMRLGGSPYAGHTELLAALTGADAVAMMMVAERTRLGGPLRVVLATTHIRLAEVPAALSASLLVEQAGLTAGALRSHWGIDRPRIALCAVNPHASDGGLFGDEESRVVEPAVAALRRSDIDATGPVPADTVFLRALGGDFDAVVAPYHDVGMAAFKTASFGLGVNVTLGLPFPRTSPDHGTAIDIAGKGVADPTSMHEAIGLAARLAMRGGEVGGEAA